MRAFINIGSNLGDRRALLRRALEEVAARFDMRALSRAMKSEPWGFDSLNPFLNICAGIESDLSPLGLLQALQQIEKSISPASHRDQQGRYADRLIDIDIVEIEGVKMDTPVLTLPHPHLHERPFFLLPLREAKEGWKDKKSVNKCEIEEKLTDVIG